MEKATGSVSCADGQHFEHFYEFLVKAKKESWTNEM